MIAARFLSRIFCLGLGLTVAGWGLYTIPIFLDQRPLLQTTHATAAGDTFSPKETSRLEAVSDDVLRRKICMPSAVRAAAIFRASMIERTFETGDGPSIDRALQKSDDALQAALDCVPSDSLLWLLRFWIENIARGFGDTSIRYLDLSYRLGPNEGAVILRRNRLVFGMFESLPADLQQHALHDITMLLRSGYYNEVADTLAGPAWKVRDRVLANFADVPQRHRQVLADILYKRGADIAVPGIERSSPRPWH